MLTKFKKKNIAFIIGHLSHGGAEKQLFLVNKMIDKSLFNPIVICLSKTPAPWGNRIEKIGVKVVYLRRFSRFDFFRLIEIIICLYKYKIDLIVSYLHIANVYSWLARIFYHRKNSYIAQIRSKEDNMSIVLRYLNIKAFNSANVIITNTSLLKIFAQKYFKQNTKKIFVVNNGIEILDLKLRKARRKINLCIVGKDTHAKNIELFIKLALKLIPDFNNIHFNLCGKGLHKNSRLYKTIPSQNRHFFTFHGEVDNVNKYYLNNDIYISTSRSEGSPNAILEAMNNGLAVVATDVGGVRELIIHEKTGFLVKSGDLDALYLFCKILLKESKLRSRIRKNSEKHINKNYSVIKMIKSYENIFSML
jgi:glycosyltransferase involved in cell wall biosynthesis